MAKQTFEAVLKRPEGIGTWTYLDIPFSVVEAFGSKGQVRVKGTVNAHPFRSSAMPHGDGTHYLVVAKPIRDAIGAGQGDTVQVVMTEDAGERTVAVPADFKRALAKKGKARTAFEALSYSHRKEYVDWLEGAKRPETRVKRIAQAMDLLLAGKTPKGRKE